MPGCYKLVDWKDMELYNPLAKGSREQHRKGSGEK